MTLIPEVMKKILILGIAFLLTAAVAAAQGTDFHRKYRNFSWSQNTMASGGDKQKSELGFAFTSGRTYFLHGKPIAGMLKVGIDATWADINYTKYEDIRLGEDGPADADWHQLEYSLQVGPSVALNPVGKLNVNAYFRYAPTFSLRYSAKPDAALAGNYATLFVTGGMVSWGIIGIGAEYRFGNCSYRNFIGESASPADMSGFRAFITLRFK